MSHTSLSAKPVEIIAHRGVRTDANPQRMAPENTLPAFKEAARQGAAVELDVFATRDGHVVVHHDYETGRVFNLPGGEKDVTQCTFAELKAAKLNQTGHEQTVKKMLGPGGQYTTPDHFKKAAIPELETVLDTLPNTHVYIELKVDTDNGQKEGANQLEERVARLIKDKNLYDRVTVIGFSPWSLKKIKALDPKIKTGLNFETQELANMLGMPKNSNFQDLARRLKQENVQVDSIQPSFGETTPELVDFAHDAKLPIKPWVYHQTRDEEKALFPQLIAMGVDGLITNSVDLLKQAVPKKSKSSAPASNCSSDYTILSPLCYTDGKRLRIMG